MTNFNLDTDTKVNEFAKAIENYSSHWGYKTFEVFVSFLVVTLQAVTLFKFIHNYTPTSYFCLIVILVIAYAAADFINGLIHMYMDNNTAYQSLAGPFIAAFHLHHAKLIYTKRPILKVYFDESGTKFWLLVYLFFLLALQLTVHLNVLLNLGLVAFSIFSSLAELSHYWCHNATDKNKLIRWLQDHHILLSQEYHKSHHCSDNIQYAFLNGTSDPLINLIARYCCKGYKNYADQHLHHYMSDIESHAP